MQCIGAALAPTLESRLSDGPSSRRSPLLSCRRPRPFLKSTMREEFRNCTVLCIAHRLHTIIYYDRLVLLLATGFSLCQPRFWRDTIVGRFVERCVLWVLETVGRRGGARTPYPFLAWYLFSFVFVLVCKYFASTLALASKLSNRARLPHRFTL